MLIRQVPQIYHSDNRWIWILEALSNTNPSKKLTVPTISGFRFWQLYYLTGLIILFSRGGHFAVRKISREDNFAKFHSQWIFFSREENVAYNQIREYSETFPPPQKYVFQNRDAPDRSVIGVKMLHIAIKCNQVCS